MSERDRGVYAPPLRDEPGFGPISGGAEEGRGRGPLLLGVTLAVLFAVIGVIWSSYNKGVREGGRDAPPRLFADSEPIKERPEAPGGEQVDNQDMTIFDVLEDPPAPERDLADVDGSEREYLASLLNDDINGARADAQPPIDVQPLWEISEPADADDGDVEALASDVGALPPEPRLKPLQRTPGEVVAGEHERGRPRTLADASSVIEPPQAESNAEPATQTPAAEASTAEAAGGVTEARPATPTTSPPVTTGAFLVQIASFRSSDAADAGWTSFADDFADMLDGRRRVVTRADLGDRGVHYRLRVGDFGDRQAASTFCDQLKTRGQECLVAGP